MDIQESGDVLGSQGAGRGRIGLGHILTLSFGLEGGTRIGFDKEDEYLSEIDRLNELFNVIL